MIRCQRLDDYLNGEMIDVERDRFEAHLPACETCAREVRSARTLQGLLATANVELTPIPVHLRRRIHSRIRKARTLRFATGAVAAAAIAVAVTWRLALSPHSTEVSNVSSARAIVPPEAPVRIAFPDGDVMAVRQAVDSMSITFLWVYQSPRAEDSQDSPRRDQ